MMDERPIGIFDSGVGGLSVVRELQRISPNERIIYFADTAYFPYGPRPAAEVRKRAFAIAARLLQSNVKLIVAACNTASAASLEDLRSAFDVPLVGMVPGVKPAALRSRSGRVVILATPGTLDGSLYTRVVAEFGSHAHVVNVSGGNLAELVESGRVHSPETASVLRSILIPEVGAGADTVVLGCTHYHFLRPVIEELFPGLSVIDTADAVARRVTQVLSENALEAPAEHPGSLSLIVSGNAERFRDLLPALGIAARPLEATRS